MSAVDAAYTSHFASDAAADGHAGDDAVAARLQTHGGHGWNARLALGFARRGDRTLLARRRHSGPLVVQKALHPEGPGVCQAIVVHPPGGIVGGDTLALDIDVDAGAHAQLSTPGAAKWYRSTGARAVQTVTAHVAAGAVLEWLPQEAIVFDGACAAMATRIALARDSLYFGWELACLGRAASGERFVSGAYRQRVELVRDGALIWAERAAFDGSSPLCASPAGLNGHPMFGTFVVAAPVLADELLAAWRRVAPEAGLDGAVTRLPGVLVARCRGASPEIARRWFTALWRVARPALAGIEAVPPRIWTT